MNDYYIYQYLNELDIPFYIGKGKGRRLFARHLVEGKNIVPKDKSKIKIIEEGLTESESLELEKLIIQELGREREGGILVNQRCGGRESGQVFSDEARAKMSAAKQGTQRSSESKVKQSISTKEFWETYDSTDRDKKISQSLKGRVIGCRKKKSIAAKKRVRPGVSCLCCKKEGKMPTMVRHFRLCGNKK